MQYVIKGRNPESVFRFFEQIAAIPHPSFGEERIADYLVAFSKERGLEYYRDALHNVLIKKPGTPGRESEPPVLLQGHTDMVCEKNGDCDHDFDRDPLRLFVEGDLLGARGTTLGGDDGIAVAMMLAVLAGELSSHPPVECLFTVCEEVGLNGAQGFDYSRISARRMINLDSEDLGIITAGCAGGLRSELTLAAERIPFFGECIKISLSGLMGGHSGVDIATGRANANKLMGRLLARLSKCGATRLVSLSGGSKDNAIPRECEALVSVWNAQEAIGVVRGETERISAELVAEDGFFAVSAVAANAPATMLGARETACALAVLGAPNGVLEMNRDVKDLPEYSRNLGVIRTEGEKITFVFSTRSSMESRLDASIDELDALAAVTGCATRHHSRYPGWSYAPVSPLREAYQAAFLAVTGREATVNVIHAGLECGIIYSHIPEMDIISVGPDMKDIHSPNERLDLASVEIFWKTVEKLIELL